MTDTTGISTPSAPHTRPLGLNTTFSALKPTRLSPPPATPPPPSEPTSAYPHLAPHIARLPPELLHLVFELVKSEVCAEYENAPTEREGTRKPDWMGWRNVTQVCQRWRRIALASSTLWREIKFRRVGLAWGLEMLSRSRLSPLKIELGHAPTYTGFPSESHSLHFATTLLTEPQHAKRLQTFTLFGVDMECVASLLFVGEEGGFEGLEDLQVETRWDDVRVSFEGLRRTMPRLRELRLYGPLITHAPSEPLIHLTHLNLQHDNPASGLSGLLLPDILRLLPSLVDLQLTDVFPPRDLIECMPPIPLAKTVQTIALTTRWRAEWAIAFGRVLSHPSAAREYVLEDCDSTHLSSLLARYAGSEGGRRPSQVGIVVGHPTNSVTLSVCYDPWARDPPQDARLPRHNFAVTFGDRPELWDVVRDNVDLRGVCDVGFEDDEDMEDELRRAIEEEGGVEAVRDMRWTGKERWKIFGGAPVQRIRVTGLACRNLFSILSSPPECPSCDDPTTTTPCGHLPSLFPLLSELTILESPSLDSPRPARPLGPAPFANGTDLVQAVKARQKRFGGRIGEVKVPDRFLYDVWVDEVLVEVGRVSNSRYRYF
ncbi:unnamed protein product [Peniophora sp. CBMAI 1063]|nr:unnamed protein product [Peniophora sp. CBMAI 1063]